MKTFWKVLGFAALAAGLTPYKVDKNEETGESSYQALLWHGSSKPGEEGGKREVLINLGEGTLTSKILDAVEKKKEAHLFSDELSVEYHGSDEEDVSFEVVDEAEDAAAESEDVAAGDEPAAVEAETAEVEDTAAETEGADAEVRAIIAEAEDAAEAAAAEAEAAAEDAAAE